MMRPLLLATVLSAVSAAGAAPAKVRVPVTVGGLCEATYGIETPRRISDEKLGSLAVLFVEGAWTADMVRDVAAHCRANGMRFTMDEMLSRTSRGPYPHYKPLAAEVVRALRENADVLDGSLLACEFGGVMWNWPLSSVEGGDRIPIPVKTYAEADAFALARVREFVSDARALGLPRPYISIEPACGPQNCLLKGGIDRLDVEVLLDSALERRFGMTAGATFAHGRPSFGADMAMVWYGGMQKDELWWARWRTSLRHAYLRGASPIYCEHGLMDYAAYGRRLGTEHPEVVRFRRTFGDFAAWVRAHPRAAGLPRAAVAAVYGRHDGFAGGWQTHLWGQRQDESFRVGAADDAWELFDGLYRRNPWEDRERWGDADASGNPPLGTAHVLPHDAPDACFDAYQTLFFLGRNVMDDALYAKLVRFVERGGKLLVSAAHMDAADAPGRAFCPYNGGDWSRLLGLRTVGDKRERMPYGLRFTAEPGLGWRVPLIGTLSDPMFVDGGYTMPVFERAGAEPIAIATDRFDDRDRTAPDRNVLYVHRLGRGVVVFVPSLESPGERGVRKLYAFLLARAVESTVAWPQVECSDRVRWATYPDGTLYLLNTEERLSSEAVVRLSPSAEPVRVNLAPGEFREFGN